MAYEIGQTCMFVHMGLTRSECASWVQAWGSIAAICAAVGIAWWQRRVEALRQRVTDQVAERHAHAAVVLGLQGIASELRRVNVLAGFQIDAVGNPIIYADISAEFRALAVLCERLPIEQIVRFGKLQTFLDLRRSASELALLYIDPPKQGDGFYLRNRQRLVTLHDLCSGHASTLTAELKELDPALYAKNEQQMLRL